MSIHRTTAILMFISIASFTEAVDLTTVSGKTYKEVGLGKITDKGLQITHEAGSATIPYAELPEQDYVAPSEEERKQKIEEMVKELQAKSPFKPLQIGEKITVGNLSGKISRITEDKVYFDYDGVESGYAFNQLSKAQRLRVNRELYEKDIQQKAVAAYEQQVANDQKFFKDLAVIKIEGERKMKAGAAQAKKDEEDKLLAGKLLILGFPKIFQVYENSVLSEYGDDVILIVDIDTTNLVDGDTVPYNVLEGCRWLEESENKHKGIYSPSNIKYLRCINCNFESERFTATNSEDEKKKYKALQNKYENRKCSNPDKRIYLYLIGTHSYTNVQGARKKIRKYTYSREKALEYFSKAEK